MSSGLKFLCMLVLRYVIYNFQAGVRSRITGNTSSDKVEGTWKISTNY